MYDDGQVYLHCPVALPVECVELLVDVGLVPIEVDAYLAHCHIPAAAKLVLDGGKRRAIVSVDFGGVESHSHRGAGCKGIVQAVHRFDGVEVDVGQQHMAHAAVEGALHHLLPVGVEFFKIDVRVGVNHFAWAGEDYLSRLTKRVMKLQNSVRASALMSILPRASSASLL